jgi:hypothetical protein
MTSCIGSKCFKNRSASASASVSASVSASASSSLTRNICTNLTPDVIGIIHYTNYKNLLSIINDGQISSKIQLLKNKKNFDQISSISYNSNIDEGEFPGVFTSLLLKQNIGYKYPNYGEIYLKFSKVLLKQKNYHIRPFDNMGLLDKDAYSREYIDKAIAVMRNIISEGGYSSYNLSGNELVFHNPISLNALESIVVTKQYIYNKLKNVLPEPYKSMLVYTQQVEDKVYNKYCNLSLKELTQRNIIDTKSKPNFCIFIHHDWESIKDQNGNHKNIPKYIDPSIYKKFADNCGVNITDLTEEYNNSDKNEKNQEQYYKKVNKRIETAVYKHFNTNERLNPKWIPGKNLFNQEESS